MKKTLNVLISIFFICFAVLIFTACSDNTNGDDSSAKHIHSFGEWETVTEATCTTDGLKKRLCADCNFEEISPIAANGHILGEWETVTEATCTTDGVARCMCLVCGKEVEGNAIIAYGHNYIDGECVRCHKIDGLEFTFNQSTQTYFVYKYHGDFTKVNIPSIYDDKVNGMHSVTCIGDRAFYDCSNLIWINIPEGVTVIGNSAFSDCSSLTNINIPEGVTAIGSSAFSNCSSLTNINIPEGVTAIGSSAFSNCSSLTNINIPEGVTAIGSSAFSNCSSLTNITIPDSVTSIGGSAFRGCTGLTSITIPDSVTSIGDDAFCFCCRLVEVYNKSSLNITVGSSDYGNVAYYAKAVYTDDYISKLSMVNGYIIYTDGEEKSLIVYTGTDTELVLPADITEINNYAFYNCNNITSITIPNSVTSIGEWAFFDCSGLTSINIGRNVTNIEDYAFSSCSGLTSITIPDSVTSFGEGAFRGCYKLIEVYNKSSLNLTAGSSKYGYVTYYAKNVYTEESGSRLSADSNGYIIYSDGEEKVLVGYTGSETALTIPEDITEINNYAFYKCSNLTSVTIPDSVTSIGSYAFFNCTEIKQITIGKNVMNIGDNAFSWEDLIGGNNNGLKVYYMGTMPEWDSKISIGRYNYGLRNRYYYSETAPVLSGKYWHYDERGNIREW